MGFDLKTDMIVLIKGDDPSVVMKNRNTPWFVKLKRCRGNGGLPARDSAASRATLGFE